MLPRVCTHLVEAGGLTRVVAGVRHLDGGQVQPRHGVGGRVRQRAQPTREVHQHLQRGRSRAVNGTSRNFIVDSDQRSPQLAKMVKMSTSAFEIKNLLTHFAKRSVKHS